MNAFPIGTALLGRAVAADGLALDRGPALPARRRIQLKAPSPCRRAPLDRPFWTGIRAIDGLLTLARGARVGLFGPPGAGKSTLLELLVRGARADAIVVGLAGERGREAQTWIERIPPHASVVCATSDRDAASRVRAAHAAMAQAHELRARGLHVLLVLDSLARFGAALRELRVAAGESVGRAGFPPGVFADMAAFLEVAGAIDGGSITLVATVLSDGDERDPVSDAARSLLDGHVQLEASLAQSGHFPAIDVLASASRTMAGAIDSEHAAHAALVRSAVAALQRSRDARDVGIASADPAVARALAVEPTLLDFLQQGGRPEPHSHTLAALAAIADRLK